MSGEPFEEPHAAAPQSVTTGGRVDAFMAREAVGICAAVTVVALAVSPRNAAALTALLVCALWPLGIAAARGFRAERPGAPALGALAAGCAAALFLLGRSMLSADARVSLVGAIGQHTGALVWVTAFVVALTAALAYRPGDLGRSARAIGVTAGVLGVAAVLDAAGLFSAVRFSAEPSGFMENSGSLGQLLALGAWCAAAWALGVRRPVQRVSAWTAVGACLAGLAVAQSTGAWLGLVIGGAVGVGALALARRTRLRGAFVAGVLVAVAAAGVAALAFAVSNGVSPGIEQQIADASNDRYMIWASAVAQTGQFPVAGAGAEQFSAWVDWELEPGPRLRKTGTYDPHNLGLYWLVSGGFIGAAVALIAVWSALAAALRTLAAAPAPPVAGLVAALSAWFVSVMLVWSTPLALVIAALVAGQLAAASPRLGGEGREAGPFAAKGFDRAAIAVTAVAGVLVAALVVSFGAASEYRWAAAIDRQALTPDIALAAALETGDPSFAALAAQSALGAPGASADSVRATLDALRPMLQAAADWHVDAAFELFTAEAAALDPEPPVDFSGPAEALASGKRADPASGLWDAVGAVQASVLGLDQDAAEFARAAARYPLPTGARAAVEEAGR